MSTSGLLNLGEYLCLIGWQPYAENFGERRTSIILFGAVSVRSGSTSILGATTTIVRRPMPGGIQAYDS